MKAIHPYLIFNGNCREAMEFYAEALGGKLQLMTWAEAPEPPQEGADRVMHSRLMLRDGLLMASDTPAGQPPTPEGRNVGLSIECSSREEEQRIFRALSEGGHVMMPLQDTFWGAHYGMLTDKFGIWWMLDFGAAE